MPHLPGLGAIYGIVAENGNPVQGANVRLLDRTGPSFLRTGVTAEDGGFVFSGLNTETDDYMIFVTDDTGGTEEDPYKNALIQDRITPVPVHVGEHYPSSWIPKVMALKPAVLFPAPYIDARFDYIQGLQFDCTAGHGYRADGGVISYTNPSPFVETAFQLPTVELIDTVWLRMSGGYSGGYLGNATVSRFSMFVVADFSTDWGFTQLAQTCTSTYTSSDRSAYKSVSPLVILSFNGVGTIRVELCMAYTDSTSGTTYTWSPYSVLKTYNTVLPATPLGYESVGVAVRNGGEVWLYVGEDEYLLDNTAVPIKFNGASTSYPTTVYAADAAFHSWNRAAATSGRQKMSIYMFTPYFMNHEKFLELRDALITPQFPNETGYAREVTIDCPSALYMMDERNPANGYFLEHYIGDTTGLAPDIIAAERNRSLRILPGLVFDTTLGPLAGRAACAFDGTTCLYQNEGAGGHSRNFTISGWLKHSTHASEAWVTALQESTTNIASRQFDIALTPANKFRVYLAGTAENNTFDRVLPVDEWYHFAIVIEKSAETMRLYVNGEFQQAIQLTTTPVTYDTLLNGSVGEPAQRCLVVGGRLNGTTVTQRFTGAMCGLAFFSYALLDYRIAAHYASKDTV